MSSGRGWLALIGLLSSLTVISPANAEFAELIVPQPLRAEPDLMSAEVASLASDSRVDILERLGGWTRVRAGDLEGWLRILALRAKQPLLPSAQNVSDLFRPGATNYARATAVAGFRGVPVARPSSHALVLTIGEYGNGIPRLSGVVHDAGSARLMARALGVPEANSISLKDAELTLMGMRAALDALEARILPNDEVFLYYSGHGTRLLSYDGRAARCSEALVTADGQALMDNELQDRLARIAAKARRVVVFMDACHSGGVTARAVGVQGLSTKFWAKDGAGTCERPSNALTRGLADTKPGEGKLNFIHIAAARDDEVALDAPGSGGLASQAWLDCLAGAARDTDGSAGLSAAELAACAQPMIERLTKDNPLYSAHHLTLTGNAAMVLNRPEPLPPLSPTVPEQPAPSFQAPQEQFSPPLHVAPATPEVAPPPPPAKPDAAATLRDIHANRDDRRVVHLTTDKPAYRVKQDRVTFTLNSSHAGYVYLLMVGSDGKRFDLLFPNQKDDRNHILAGETWKLPRAGWSIRAGGPAGKDYLLAIVSDNPRDFSGLGMQAAGPFSVLSVSPGTTRDILFVSDVSANANTAGCLEVGQTRTMAIANACSDAYGADLITLDEVE